MSGYTRNAVYDYVSNAIQAEYPNANCTSRYLPKPSAYPSCYIREVDNYRPVEYTQLDFEDVQWESAFEIQIVSNKKGTAASEAYAIMKVAKAAMSRLYYREFSETAVDRTETYTVIARFRRKIGGGDVFPQS